MSRSRADAFLAPALLLLIGVATIGWDRGGSPIDTPVRDAATDEAQRPEDVPAAVDRAVDARLKGVGSSVFCVGKPDLRDQVDAAQPWAAAIPPRAERRLRFGLPDGAMLAPGPDDEPARIVFRAHTVRE